MTSSFASAFARLPLLARINVLALGLALVALSIRLWPEWRHNPDLSHGFFMPLIFVLLVYESRHAGPSRFLRRSVVTRAAFGLLLGGGLLALVAAGLYAVAVDWSHALVNFMLAISLVLLLGAALVALADESIRLIPCNWIALVAIGLWLLSVPIPPGTYTRLTLGLQLWVSEAVLRALHVLGIAAIRHGNIIELARTTVGVEEACSGVRSLISCVFAGLFFSATLVRQAWARGVIIALAAPLALLMNFLRSLALTLLSNSGVDIAGFWHDATGFAVLGVTAIILGGLALLLGRATNVTAATEIAGGDGHRTRPAGRAGPASPPSIQVLLAGGLFVALALVVFFIANTRPSPRRDAPVPDLLALLPPAPPGWMARTSDDLYQFSSTLRTENLAERRYVKEGPAGRTEVTLYLAYWRAGQASVSLVASHTPEACWPGSGWTMLGDSSQRVRLTAGGRTLPESEYRLFKEGDFPQHVWFWHLYDGHPISYRDPYSPSELLRIAVRYGFRHDGDQLFVRASSNRPWSELAHEPLLADFFARTQALGL